MIDTFSILVAAFGDGTSTSLTIYRRSGEVNLEDEANEEDEDTNRGTTVSQLNKYIHIVFLGETAWIYVRDYST